MIIGRILGWILIAVGLAWTAIGLSLWLSGHDMTAVAGQLWFQVDATSLNRTQSIVERYFHPGLWEFVFVPLLRKPVYYILGLYALVPLVTGVLLAGVFRSRGGKKRLFR